VGGQGSEGPLRIEHLAVSVPGLRFAAEILPQRQTQTRLDLPLPGRRLRGRAQPRQAVAGIGFPIPEGQQLQQLPLLGAGQLFRLLRRIVPPHEPPRQRSHQRQSEREHHQQQVGVGHCVHALDP
jgi:hypothetical protein